MAILPTLKQLAHLAALAEHQHFGKAARACHVTQSTLSASIAALEDALQAQLVDRGTRLATLTPLGAQILRQARQILEQAEALVATAQATQEPLSGSLRMGVIPTIGPFLLPRMLGRLRERYPALQLYLKEDLTARLIEQLEHNQLDLALLALPYSVGAIATLPLFEDRFSFCCPATHPLAKAKRIEAAQLAKENLLLLQDGHCLRDHALAACRLRENLTIDPFAATSLYTIVQMVSNGLGVTLLPQLAIDSGILRHTALASVPLATPAPARTIGLAWRRNSAREKEFRLLGNEIKAFHDAEALDSP